MNIPIDKHSYKEISMPCIFVEAIDSIPWQRYKQR